MMIRKQNCNTQTVRRKEHRSSEALKGMVTGTRKLNTDHLKFHLITETGKKMESNSTNESDENEWR